MIHPKNETKSLVFDTNIFLLGIDFNILEGQIYTSPKVLKEIKKGDKNRNILNKIQVAIESRKLKVKAPSENYVELIRKKSKTTGDYKAA